MTRGRSIRMEGRNRLVRDCGRNLSASRRDWARPRGRRRVRAAGGAVVREQRGLVTCTELPDSPDIPSVLCGARVLTLDTEMNIHSMYREEDPGRLTGSYWDYFAIAPALVPEVGPVAVLGLGSGTALHILDKLWPGWLAARPVHGWELDKDVVDIARAHMGLGDLERLGLVTHVSDALGEEFASQAEALGGFSSILVDLFAEGRSVPALQEMRTWHLLAACLKEGGRLVANVGADEHLGAILKAATGAFGSEAVHTKDIGDDPDSPAANVMLYTGARADEAEWRSAMPELLKDMASGWEPMSNRED